MPNSSSPLLHRPEPASRYWRPGADAPAFSAIALAEACADVRASHHVIRDQRDGRLGLGRDGEWVDRVAGDAWPVLASLPPLYPEWLGDRSFAEVHGLRFPYVAGAMANGIATVALVSELARNGFLGFFGAAGLSPGRVETAIDELQRELGPTGLDEYRETKHIWQNTAPGPTGWFGGRSEARPAADATGG